MVAISAVVHHLRLSPAVRSRCHFLPPGTGQVSRIAVIFGPGIQQELRISSGAWWSSLV